MLAAIFKAIAHGTVDASIDDTCCVILILPALYVCMPALRARATIPDVIHPEVLPSPIYVGVVRV